MTSRALPALLLAALLFPLGCSSTPASDEASQSALDNPDGLDDATLYWVNKERCMPCGFAPQGLVNIDSVGRVGGDGTLAVRDFVQAPLQKMLADARTATGDTAVISSSYRSFSLQVSVLNNESNNSGIGPCQAAREVAPPGHSEHQLGTAVDLGVASGPSGAGYLDGFGRTAAATWIHAHAYEYGFALSYPDAAREAITGYRHEPWHFRFVGKTAAKAIHDHDWSVEEYFRNAHPKTADLPMACEACEAGRGDLSGCPTNTSTTFTCGQGPSAGSRVRCELGLITCEACAGGACDARPAGQDDVCRNGTAPDAGTSSGSCSAIWTCSADNGSRTRCVDGKVETETCAAGCVARAYGTDDVCGCPAGITSPVWTCNSTSTERHRCVNGGYEVDACTNGCQAMPPGTDDTCK